MLRRRAGGVSMRALLAVLLEQESRPKEEVVTPRQDAKSTHGAARAWAGAFHAYNCRHTRTPVGTLMKRTRGRKRGGVNSARGAAARAGAAASAAHTERTARHTRALATLDAASQRARRTTRSSPRAALETRGPKGRERKFGGSATAEHWLGRSDCTQEAVYSDPPTVYGLRPGRHFWIRTLSSN